MIKVSIITVTKNSAKTLERTLLSIKNQTYKNIEYIIVDGQSDDGTLEIINKYNGLYDKLIVEKDECLYDGLNKGIKIATGDFIGILHSDDVFYDEYVIENIFKNDDVINYDCIYGNLEYYDQFGKLKRTWKSNPYEVNTVQYGWMPPHPTLYIKKSIYKKYGLYNVNYKLQSDYDYILRMFSGGVKSKYYDLYMIKMMTGGLSGKHMIKGNIESIIILIRNGYMPSLKYFFYKLIMRAKQFI
jgi:glycosyltransferase